MLNTNSCVRQYLLNTKDYMLNKKDEGDLLRESVQWLVYASPKRRSRASIAGPRDVALHAPTRLGLSSIRPSNENSRLIVLRLLNWLNFFLCHLLDEPLIALAVSHKPLRLLQFGGEIERYG